MRTASFSICIRGLLAVMVLLLAFSAPVKASAWEVWKACRLESDRYFDGDSFHVVHGKKHDVIRLYFVDAPETDSRFPTRVQAQAAYFGVSKSLVLTGGASTKAFTARFLSEPFSVITRREPALGASRMQRYYAIVERDGWRLDAALVQAGLARVTSHIANYPDEAAGFRRRADLTQLEARALGDRKGIWANSSRHSPALAPKKKRASSATTNHRHR